MKKSRLLAMFFSFAILLIVTSANAVTWTTIDGRVLTQTGTPICAMVLANGQHMFSCGGIGNYNLRVPLDSKGLVTLQVFASKFAPFRQTLTAGQAIGYNVYMDRDTSGRAFTITHNEFPSPRNGWVLVSGNIDSNGTPVCAMILINGQSMFSCNQNLGRYSLEVPLDSSGNITPQAFAAGFMPFRTTFPSDYPDTGETFSLAVFKSTDPGTVYSTQVVGSDTYGTSYSGSFSLAIRAKEMQNGVFVTPRDVIISLSGGGNSFTNTATSYTDTGGNLISTVVQTTGLVCTPVSSGRMPDTVKIGDFGILPSLTCNDNTTQATSWRVNDAGNGRIQIITSTTARDQFNGIASITDITYTLASGGNVIAIKAVTRLVPENYTLTFQSI